MTKHTGFCHTAFAAERGVSELCRAVRAAGRVVGNLALAERADALGLGRGSFRLLVNLVHRADDEEHAERGQDEVDDVLDEQAVVDRADTGRCEVESGR